MAQNMKSADSLSDTCDPTIRSRHRSEHEEQGFFQWYVRSYNTESRDQNTSQTSSSDRCGGLAIDPLFGESQSSDARTVKAKNHAKSELNRGRTYQGKEEEKKKQKKRQFLLLFDAAVSLQHGVRNAEMIFASFHFSSQWLFSDYLDSNMLRQYVYWKYYSYCFKTEVRNKTTDRE